MRAGVIYEEMYQFGEAISRLSSTEMLDVAERIPLPPELEAMLTEHEGDKEQDEESAASEASEEQDAQRMPMLKLIGSLSIAQRVALAVRGNREARTILVRDSNRVVASAAIRSPRITEQEVIAAAQSRSVCSMRWCASSLAARR